VNFTFTRLTIPDVFLIDATAFGDERGFFKENYKETTFRENGISTRFVQDNFSHSVRGVLRGLHFQKNPKAQAKLVSALKGKIFDVAVDIRKGSPTFGKWVGEVLSDQNHRLLFIPEGFAHAFCVLSQEADVFYKVSQEYSPEHDSGIVWNDPEVNISWPIENPIISKKDLGLAQLKDADNNF